MADHWTNNTADTGSEWQADAVNIDLVSNYHDAAPAADFSAGGYAGEASGACRNCGQEGHFARECTEPRKMGPCFNCGEEGHSKAECTKPRVFTGECKNCSEVGHRAADCPAKPKNCLRCKVEGDHDTKDCTNNYYIDLTDVADMSEGAAWAKMKKASDNEDLDDFKEAMRILQKTAPEVTYTAIEKQLRRLKFKFFLIALKKESGDAYTFVDLQGVPDKTYCVAIMKSAKCQRPTMVDKWPGSLEDNLTRLADAGVAFERHVEFCRTCEKYGHSTRSCDQERVVPDGPQVQCALCSEIGHRVRDCTEPRKKPRGPMECRVCGGEHLAKDCDQKPAITCRNCNQEGHKSSECTEPRVQRCRNCDEPGHTMRECTIPIDYSKMTCRHCGEKGHLSDKKCDPKVLKKKREAEGSGDTGGNSYADNNVATGDAGYGNGDASFTGSDFKNGDGGYAAVTPNVW